MLGKGLRRSRSQSVPRPARGDPLSLWMQFEQATNSRQAVSRYRCIPKQPDLSTAPRGAVSPSTTGLSPSLAPFFGGLELDPSLRALLHTTIRTTGSSNSQVGLFLDRSSCLGKSLCEEHLQGSRHSDRTMQSCATTRELRSSTTNYRESCRCRIAIGPAMHECTRKASVQPNVHDLTLGKGTEGNDVRDTQVDVPLA
ncbi:Hypothetical predicted protein [Olea europaea subsp. europaea]|uniref:Uncharacterized protein n=1 Tax=Olea europaea subsp. europaea TaxID=158383 RepID=A0A8S0TW87_OLEEU|nr:Hypothetical predicted protein [Olea europaea subsp. europaea]